MHAMCFIPAKHDAPVGGCCIQFNKVHGFNCRLSVWMYAYLKYLCCIISSNNIARDGSTGNTEPKYF